jgi:hypothetical protein
MVQHSLEFRMTARRRSPCPLADGTLEGQQAGRLRQRRPGMMIFELADPAVKKNATEPNDSLINPPGGVRIHLLSWLRPE